MSSGGEKDASGCAVLFVALLAIAAVIAALISLAALVDPFSWLPPVTDVWADCEDDYLTDRDECALGNRFPGFWGHAIANLGWVLATACMLFALGGGVADLREARQERFKNAEAAERYSEARGTLAAAAVICGLLAALPIVVAIA